MRYTAMTPARLRRLMNWWPPMLFSGIRVEHVDDEWREARVRLKLRRWNRNYVGTAFGGSLFAMTDPFFMILMMNRVGRDYIVWDRAGEIRFVTPGRTDVTAHITLSDAQVAAFRAAADAGDKHLEWFSVDVVGTDGTVVATVRKQLYIRRKERLTRR
ncbi:DUF4442 domain-containing protein [Spongisporangium articulatum]|uniref:DUF4442 domain-containing protein n=1 Tax=Spongisporangium articulatum TaxID=3362603 RepID=A0ABW8AP38_9ACTN